ncbi:MAG: CpsD/CapB family tyrosine-protein kinase [Leptothrix sp. (in: b-proteobacteria)]
MQRLNEPLMHLIEADAAEPVALPAGHAAQATHAHTPLRIDYTQTRVAPEAWQRLARTPGVVPNDRSALAETFKMLRNQVLLRLRAEGHKVLAVTSPRAVHGKSLTALNLALAIAADYDSAVLLVDGDLASRQLQRHFALDAAPGLSDHLRHGEPLPDLLVNPGISRLVFLPAGRQPVSDSAELLGTRAAQQMIQAMKQRYADRYIVIDLPPLLDTADTLAFLPQADTTLLVLEQHVSKIADIEACAELLAPFPLIGSVLTPRPDEPAAAGAAGDANRAQVIAPRGWRRWLAS